MTPDIDLSKYLILKDPNRNYSDLYVAMDREFPGRKWEDSLRVLDKKGALMITLKQGTDLLQLLKSEKVVYDGNGRPVDRFRIGNILSELMCTNGKGEYLNSYFEQNENKLYLKSDNRIIEGSLDYGESQLLADGTFLNEDCFFNISSFNAQGLPTKEDKTLEEAYFLSPVPKNVAKFGRYQGKFCIDCYVSPNISTTMIGVRPVYIKE